MTNDKIFEKKRVTWIITIYRRDSETPVIYENVKHFWWEESARLVISVFNDDGPKHYYWIWPVDLISHTKAERTP